MQPIEKLFSQLKSNIKNYSSDECALRKCIFCFNI